VSLTLKPERTQNLLGFQEHPTERLQRVIHTMVWTMIHRLNDNFLNQAVDKTSVAGINERNRDFSAVDNEDGGRHADSGVTRTRRVAGASGKQLAKYA
jgi:hypothetical protein